MTRYHNDATLIFHTLTVYVELHVMVCQDLVSCPEHPRPNGFKGNQSRSSTSLSYQRIAHCFPCLALRFDLMMVVVVVVVVVVVMMMMIVNIVTTIAFIF